jgi:hypothetical protein
VKSTTVAEQVDEYVDTGDEMPAATYQSMEIEKDAEGTTGSGGSGSGSSSSSGMIKLALCSPSIVPKFLQGADFLHLQVLSRGAQGTVPQELAMLIL